MTNPFQSPYTLALVLIAWCAPTLAADKSAAANGPSGPSLEETLNYLADNIDLNTSIYNGRIPDGCSYWGAIWNKKVRAKKVGNQLAIIVTGTADGSHNSCFRQLNIHVEYWIDALDVRDLSLIPSTDPRDLLIFIECRPSKDCITVNDEYARSPTQTRSGSWSVRGPLPVNNTEKGQRALQNALNHAFDLIGRTKYQDPFE